MVLLLLTALRQTYVASSPSSGGGQSSGNKDQQYVSILDSTKQAGAMQTSLASKEQREAIVYSTALFVILKGLVLWINGTSK